MALLTYHLEELTLYGHYVINIQSVLPNVLCNQHCKMDVCVSLYSSWVMYSINKVLNK